MDPGATGDPTDVGPNAASVDRLRCGFVKCARRRLLAKPPLRDAAKLLKSGDPMRHGIRLLSTGHDPPRIVDPGATLAISRRTTRRHFLLNPDEARQMEQVYWYCLAYAAKLHGVLVHAACLMSTHCHEVITDVRGEYPKFLQTFHRHLALCTKAYRGWPEEVFNKESSGAHALLTPEAILESIAYLIANPVEAGAVRYAKDWPGAHTLPAHVGTRVIRVKRPKHYFDPEEPGVARRARASFGDAGGARARLRSRACP